MFESTTRIGERGQITIPKDIRDMEGLKPKDRVIVKIEDGQIIVEKTLTRSEKEQKMKEGYLKLAKEDERIEKEMKYTTHEAEAMLDEY